ncbi:MAG TPA: glycerate kinase [Puia sp.]|nr:glycerate kinase [Puia sp.]HWB90974.1 glycerate kinase [Puia sp.]
MKVLIAPDKFKGSLTSFEACNAIATGVRAIDPAAEIFEFPMADGGDGFAAVMKHYRHTKTITCPTEDPLGRPLATTFELKDDTAIIEMASASGLVLLQEKQRDPLQTSTYGTGRMIRAAIDAGAKKIILGLGGSATNDAGIGILAALGFQFIDQADHPIQPIGGNLIQIHHIIPPATLPDIKFTIACDVQNVLYGEQGAAYIYAPQKGATPEAVIQLDKGLRHFAGLLKKDVAGIPGAGAAGGIATGLMGFFDVRLAKGVELVIDSSDIKDKLSHADLVITGEGKIDRQTEYGKVVSEIAGMAAQHQIPAIAFCGVSEVTDPGPLHLAAIRTITPRGMLLEEAMANAKSLLTAATTAYFK